ncbi:MocR-like transcription factor YczR [Martelella alba]|uniref:MocR-like transcription factor YczR n=1 Tax=Martelella alba TaxID=2590451 RepID=UPI001E38256B|nr:PLP-dependent aminotransferase family protein [Martelella alba]
MIHLLGHWRQNTSRAPLWRQLAEALRLLILDSRLGLDNRLPGERELAAALQVSRTTVVSALNQLREEGYLQSRQGSGSRVALPAQRPTIPTRSAAPDALDLSVASLSAGCEIHQAYQHALAMMPYYLSGAGYAPQGLTLLRDVIAKQYCLRGLPTEADEVMIVNGALNGFALILRLMTVPGDRVLIEHPTYPLAIEAIKGVSCQPIGFAMAAAGWDVAGFMARIAQTAPRLAYLIPDYQNPTGLCMDAATREVIASVAARTRTPLVIDETMADLWYDEPPPLPMAAFHRQAAIFTLGSASKSFWGGLRVGWIRAPRRLIASLVQIRDTLDLGSPILEQVAVAWLVQQAGLLMPPRRELLKHRRDETCDLLSRYFPEWEFTRPDGGLSLWLKLPGMLATAFASRAENAGIHLGTGTRFGLNGAFDRFLRMPFVTDRDTLAGALSTLRPLWLELLDQPLAAGRMVLR